MRQQALIADAATEESQDPSNEPMVAGKLSPLKATELFRDAQYDLSKETIGREMNLLNGVIQAAKIRFSDPRQINSIDPLDLMKAAMAATKIKAQIMGPEAYQYERHFEELQHKMEAVLQVINECVDQETKLKIYARLRELDAEQLQNM